jgi:hypothetical protein
MVVMNAAGRAVAMRVRAWRAVRHESAAGVNGSPYVMLPTKTQFSGSKEENIMVKPLLSMVMGWRRKVDNQRQWITPQKMQIPSLVSINETDVITKNIRGSKKPHC